MSTHSSGSRDSGSIGKIDDGIIDELARRAERAAASSIVVGVAWIEDEVKLVEIHDGLVADQADRAVFVHLSTTLRENPNAFIDLRVYSDEESYAWRLNGSGVGWYPVDPQLLQDVMEGNHRTLHWNEIPIGLAP